MGNNKNFSTLRRKEDFERLRTQGRKLNPSKWMMVSVVKNQELGLRCGWSIPAKIGGSVLRNRFKRWCREFFRSACPSSPCPDLDLNVVIRVRNDIDYKGISFLEFQSTLQRAWISIVRDSSANRAVSRSLL